jgi:hypothetical protein
MRKHILMTMMATLAILMIIQSASAQGKLEGVWKITEVTLTGPNARTITNPAPSLIVFTKKHYSMIYVTADKPRAAVPQQNATDAQKVAAWTQFAAEAGTYEVKGTVLTIHPIVSKNPATMEAGKFLTSDFKFEGRTLTLANKVNQSGPLPNPYTFKLVRVE